MPTVIGDLTIEPKAAPSANDAAASTQSTGGGSKSGPELERELEKVRRRDHDRALRNWAH